MSLRCVQVARQPRSLGVSHLWNLITHRMNAAIIYFLKFTQSTYVNHSLISKALTVLAHVYTLSKKFRELHNFSPSHLLLVALLSSGAPSSSPPPSASSSLLPLRPVTPSMKFVNVSLMLRRRPLVFLKLLASP